MLGGRSSGVEPAEIEWRRMRAQMRMYRLGWLFEQLEINLSINLLWTTLFRNLLVRVPSV